MYENMKIRKIVCMKTTLMHNGVLSEDISAKHLKSVRSLVTQNHGHFPIPTRCVTMC